ncbi:MAG: gluconate 2-dehydrogenase subunit 3 family protein [Rhodothermales bacterium]|nr:gluconate 2-dehydrogenase subunit 3 family protein [Rhodothermales bacterium]
MTEIDRRTFLQRLAVSFGVVLTPGTTAAILTGCRPDPGIGRQFFTAAEYLLVGDLVERIIPATDTPGAREAGVPEYVDMLLTHFSDDQVRGEVREQLLALQGWLREHQADRIEHLDPELAETLIAALDQEAFPTAEDGPLPLDGLPGGETPLFRRLKPWTVAGYYTSEVGALQELHQSPMGVYQGDIPFAEVGKTWA